MLTTANQLVATIDWARAGEHFRGRMMSLSHTASPVSATLIVLFGTLFGAALTWHSAYHWVWIALFAVAAGWFLLTERQRAWRRWWQTVYATDTERGIHGELRAELSEMAKRYKLWEPLVIAALCTRILLGSAATHIELALQLGCTAVGVAFVAFNWLVQLPRVRRQLASL